MFASLTYPDTDVVGRDFTDTQILKVGALQRMDSVRY